MPTATIPVDNGSTDGWDSILHAAGDPVVDLATAVHVDNDGNYDFTTTDSTTLNLGMATSVVPVDSITSQLVLTLHMVGITSSGLSTADVFFSVPFVGNFGGEEFFDFEFDGRDEIMTITANGAFTADQLDGLAVGIKMRTEGGTSPNLSIDFVSVEATYTIPPTVFPRQRSMFRFWRH